MNISGLWLFIVIGATSVLATTSWANCEPTWPLWQPCSGFGECVNNTCLCYGGWTGRHDWITREGVDCLTNFNARRVILWIGWVAGLLVMLLGAYAVWRLRPSVICLPKHSLTKNQRRKSDPQIVAFLILLNVAFMVASSTGALFLDIYFRESVAMSVLFVIFAVGQLLISTVYAYLWTRIAIKTSKLSRNKKVSRALTILRIVLFSQFGLASAVCTGAALAVSIMDPGSSQQAIARVGLLGHSIGLFLEWLAFILITKYITSLVEAHITTVHKETDEMLQASLTMIKRIQGRMTVLMILVSVFEALCGILFILMAYHSPLVYTMASLSYALRILGDILPTAESNQKESSKSDSDKKGISMSVQAPSSLQARSITL